MSDEIVEPIAVGFAGWRVLTARQRPWILGHYRDHAACVEEIAERDEDGYLFVGVERPGDEWPSLLISQTFTPSVGGFSPGGYRCEVVASSPNLAISGVPLSW